MTISETGKIMDILKAAYPNWSATKNTLILWSQMFVDVPVEVVGAAVKSYIATDLKGFAPSIGQINNIIAQSAEVLTEDEAWVMVRKAIGNGLYGAGEEFEKLPDIVQRVVVSPDQLTAWAMLTEGLDTVVASNFKRAFRAETEKARRDAIVPKNVRELLESVKAITG